MIRRPARNLLQAALLLAASVAAALWHERAGDAYPRLVYFTGWSLFGLMLFLTAYNARKKLPFLPLLSSRLWLQLHLWIGLFTGLAFLLHLRWRWPSGGFEGVLAALFAGVTLSGLAGWWLSRVLPKRLTTTGGEVPFERIPAVRRALREEAEGLVLGSVPAAKATTLADFYAAQLGGHFAARANFWAHLAGSRRPLNTLLARLAEVNRFLSPAEKETSGKLAALIRQKDALDFHHANQLALKAWLFAHIPLTYGLLVFSVVHVVLVYAYSGGAR